MFKITWKPIHVFHRAFAWKQKPRRLILAGLKSSERGCICSPCVKRTLVWTKKSKRTYGKLLRLLVATSGCLPRCLRRTDSVLRRWSALPEWPGWCRPPGDIWGTQKQTKTAGVTTAPEGRSVPRTLKLVFSTHSKPRPTISANITRNIVGVYFKYV